MIILLIAMRTVAKHGVRGQVRGGGGTVAALIQDSLICGFRRYKIVDITYT